MKNNNRKINDLYAKLCAKKDVLFPLLLKYFNVKLVDIYQKTNKKFHDCSQVNISLNYPIKNSTMLYES